jgi:hypothetical protein
MKKISISLFAVLGIAFAITSAFTTAKKLTRTDVEMWAYSPNSGLDQTGWNSAGSTTSDKYNYVNDVTPTFFYRNATSGSETLDEFLESLTQTSESGKFCASESDDLCVVKVLQEPGSGPQPDGNGEQYTIVDVQFGDLTDVD